MRVLACNLLGAIVVLSAFTIACGTTEVSVDVEEVNVNTELNSSIQTTQSPITSDMSKNFQTPMPIPTPIGLESMSDAINSIGVVSDGLQETVQGISEIVASFPTSTPTPPSSNQGSSFERKGGIGHVLMAGFILDEETTTKRNYAGLESSYKGFIIRDESHQKLEVFIFNQSLSDPSLSSSVALDNMARNGSVTDFYHNLAFSCQLKSVCDYFLASLEKQSQYFESS
ncbi:MAG: hypothetical protein CL777_04225 [Chloroflexi bacterium]|nr:hypothetical protein [Chloroflexota bacterium]